MVSLASWNPLTFLTDAIRSAYVGNIDGGALIRALVILLVVGGVAQVLVTTAEHRLARRSSDPARWQRRPASERGRAPMSEHLGRITYRWRWLVVGVWVLVLVAGVVASGPLGRRVSAELDGSDAVESFRVRHRLEA